MLMDDMAGKQKPCNESVEMMNGDQDNYNCDSWYIEHGRACVYERPLCTSIAFGTKTSFVCVCVCVSTFLILLRPLYSGSYNNTDHWAFNTTPSFCYQ